MIVASLLMPLSSCHGNRKRLSSNEESSFLITYSQKEIVIESIKNKGVVEHFLLKEYSEPPFKDYELEIIKKTYFIPSEISSLVYDSWCEFPLIKVSNKNISISYEKIRGRINSAVIIDQITNDTTFVQWIYDNKGKIQKQTLNIK